MINKTILLTYPPGKLYQRGEDRSQGNVEESTATSVRACNDLGYAAAVLRKRGFSPVIRDYQTQRNTWEDVWADLAKLAPSFVMISVTNATIYTDIAFANEIKKRLPSVIITLKGSIFYDPENALLDLLDLSSVSYLLGGECELAIGQVVEHALLNIGPIENIDNILYKSLEGTFRKTRFRIWETNLDSIPFPARDLMNNSLYVRPDTNKPMATIQTSRGCPAGCIYCLSPIISGHTVRQRSVANVFAELEECYNVHHIRNFFFKADTFTIDATWVRDLCEKILHSPLCGHIYFTANSRVKPLNPEILRLMKQAGCFAVAFGYESGSDETLRRIKKGTTTALNRQAAKWAREAGLKTYGFFMIGFPWETENDLELLQKHVFELDSDFIEIHIALPYYGTELYNACKAAGVLKENVFGSDYFNSSTTGTQTLSMQRLMEFRKELHRKYYFRPRYIFRRLCDCVQNPLIFGKYFCYACRLAKQLF